MAHYSGSVSDSTLRKCENNTVDLAYWSAVLWSVYRDIAVCVAARLLVAYCSVDAIYYRQSM